MSGHAPTTDAGAGGPTRVRVVTVANARFLRGLLVTLHSLLRHLAPGWTADLTLLTDDFGEGDERLLRGVLAASGREHTLEVLHIGMDAYRDYPAQETGSRLAYARLLIPRLVAADRALYLDADIVVLRDVSELAALPWPEGRSLYAVQDARVAVCSMPWERIPWEALGIPPAAPYFNSGLLWMNLDAWRRQGVETACQEYMRRFPDRLPFRDQSVLNPLLWNQWVPLERAWNAAPENTLGRFALYPLRLARNVNVHYVGHKPWDKRNPFEGYYWREVARIAALVPPEFAVRPGWTGGDVSHWARYFVTRAYYHYGGFCKHAVLNWLRRGDGAARHAASR